MAGGGVRYIEVKGIDGPWGEFVLPRDHSDIVMLAGGIGVTPFRAIVEDANARSLPHALHIVAPRAAHGSVTTCALVAALHVLDTGSLDGVPAVCH